MMDLNCTFTRLAKNNIDEEMYSLIGELYPICRSITGDGVRSTLDILKKRIDLKTFEVPTGTQVFDWTIPKEWNIRDAYIKDGKGKKIVDFHDSNLHVLNYSIPVNKKIPLSELKNHLYSLPEHPELIPYKTSYYKETWGFCLSHKQLQQLKEDDYEVYIDATLEDGSLTYGEYYLPGKSSDEFIFSTHICHPSLCNDNLSGISVTTFLAHLLTGQKLKYSYRFLFIPGTIGSITWLSRNEALVGQIKHGLVISSVGDKESFTYKKSRRDDADIDRIIQLILQQNEEPFSVKEFSPYGYDERQFCSPAFNLPFGSLSRSAYGTYEEYHTSADNLDFIQKEKLIGTLKLLLHAIYMAETNTRYINLYPKCEPQLGKRGLYNALGGHVDSREREMAMLWILNYSDGNHSLLDIAEKSKIKFELLAVISLILNQHGLLDIKTGNISKEPSFVS